MLSDRTTSSNVLLCFTLRHPSQTLFPGEVSSCLQRQVISGHVLSCQIVWRWFGRYCMALDWIGQFCLRNTLAFSYFSTGDNKSWASIETGRDSTEALHIRRIMNCQTQQQISSVSNCEQCSITGTGASARFCYLYAHLISHPLVLYSLVRIARRFTCHRM